MKQILFFAAIIGLIQVSCKKADSHDPVPSSLDGAWRMIIVKENVSGSTTTKPSSIQGDVDITFISASSTSGTFTGKTPSNNIEQNDYSTGPNRSLTIQSLSMTNVAETSWGEEFVDNIIDATEYSFGSNGILNIKTTNKTLTFQKL
jgi:hypothetical protein